MFAWQPHTLFVTIFRRGPDSVGHVKTHLGPCHANQQLRRLRGCWSALLQPLVVKGVVDKSCKRAVREEMPGCSNRRDEGLGSHSLWAENRKNFAFAWHLPFPSYSLQVLSLKEKAKHPGGSICPHTPGQTSTGTTAPVETQNSPHSYQPKQNQCSSHPSWPALCDKQVLPQ